MTKADIVDVIAKGTGLTKIETSTVIDGFLATVSFALQNGDKVELRGFGTFCLRERQEKQVANPRTGKMMIIPHRIVPDFKPSPQLKTSVTMEMKSSGRFSSKTPEIKKRQTDIFSEIDRFFLDK
jgi:DNA-binding protein HU-beta